jgi:hypothetical protein
VEKGTGLYAFFLIHVCGCFATITLLKKEFNRKIEIVPSPAISKNKRVLKGSVGTGLALKKGF